LNSLCHFAVELPEPIDLHASLEVFRRPGDDLIDRWDGCRLLRSVPGPRSFIPYQCSTPDGGRHDHLDVLVRQPGERDVVEPAISRLFATANRHFDELIDQDHIVRRLNAAHPGVRPVLQHDLFTALVRSVSAQQINLRWAATIRARLAQEYGDEHEMGGETVYSLNVERIAAASPAAIRALQFTTRKAESIIALAQEFVDGRLSLETLRSLTDDEVIARLIVLRGIGLWSAEWILCRTLGRPCVVAGDLGVRKAVGRAYLDGVMPSEEKVRELTAHWGPSASVAQGLLLHAYAVGTT